MKKPEQKIIKQALAKGNNVRIAVQLNQDENGTFYFTVHTRRLENRKLRIIINNTILYSVETFFALTEICNSLFRTDPIIINKVLNVELSKLKPLQCFVDIIEELK